MENDTNTSSENYNEILARSFAALDRKKIKVDGLPEFYSRPLNSEDTLTILSFGIDQMPNKTPDEVRKTALKMARFIVNHAVDADGKRVFKPFNNQTAHEVLAKNSPDNLLLEIISQMRSDPGEEQELEEVLGKSESEDLTQDSDTA